MQLDLLIHLSLLEMHYKYLIKPKIELHISNIYSREEFRKKSLISDVVNGGIFGLGSNGYILAIMAMHKMLKNENK